MSAAVRTVRQAVADEINLRTYKPPAQWLSYTQAIVG